MDVEHGAIHKKIFLGESAVVTISYLVHYDTLLQNVTNMQILLLSFTVNLLQNAKMFHQNTSSFFVTVFVKNAAVIIYCDDFITKCHS